MSKATFINRRLVADWLEIQNWLKSVELNQKQEFEQRRHEMDSHEIAEHNGYDSAIADVIRKINSLMDEWPDLDKHRPYRQVTDESK